MKQSNIYVDLWNKYIPTINSKLNSCSTKRFIQLSKNEFETIGNRKKSGYSFNLEFVDGVNTNTISHSAVARDLKIVLTNSSVSREILNSGHHKISMNKNFKLTIIKLT